MLNKKALSATAAAPKVYVENVFSTYLYTGNDSTKTITNDIDLSGEGGMVWLKNRDNAYYNILYDSVRGAGNGKDLSTNVTDAEGGSSINTNLTAFNSNGFSLGATSSTNTINTNTQKHVSWSFRKAKKFFDVVTYTGTAATKTINHNLGSTPGFIITKRTDSTSNWRCYHTSLGTSKTIDLNSTNAELTGLTNYYTAVSSTSYTIGDGSEINSDGATYVAYLFAHDAGGFGDAGDQSIIKCGSYTGNGSATGPTITLDWEPQLVIIKRSSSTGDWNIFDNMRGFTVSGQNDAYLKANVSNAEASANWIAPSATGFDITTTSSELNTNSSTYIYIAIRRGPMKTPTSGTSVFDLKKGVTGDSEVVSVSLSYVDFLFSKMYDAAQTTFVIDRLRGGGLDLQTASSAAESATIRAGFARNGEINVAGFGSSATNISWFFKRAPGFCDVVRYTGTGSATTFSHNLGVVPELMIIKRRDTTTNWFVYNTTTGNTKALLLNTTGTGLTDTVYWNDTTPTGSVFTVGTASGVNASGGTYVAYLFASLSGISKIGSYTGNGSNKTINCGFTAGARFILIKRTDSTGDWYLYDSARGIVSGNDPQIKLNTETAEETGYDAIDPDNSGFIVNNDATNFPINVNNATYIYLAIA